MSFLGVLMKMGLERTEWEEGNQIGKKSAGKMKRARINNSKAEKAGKNLRWIWPDGNWCGTTGSRGEEEGETNLKLFDITRTEAEYEFCLCCVELKFKWHGQMGLLVSKVQSQSRGQN